MHVRPSLMAFWKAARRHHNTHSGPAPALERRIAEMKRQGKSVDPPGFARRSLPLVKHIVLVGAGKGGVGKSTLAANLSLALAVRGQRVGLLDADFYGPSVPRLLGLLDARAHLQPDSGHLVPVSNYGILTMSLHYLRPAAQEGSGPQSHAAVWRGLMLQKMLHRLVFDTAWGELDYLLVDLPPGTGDTPLTLCQSLEIGAISGAVLISTPQAVALDDVAKAAQMFQLLNIPILGWVKNMTFTTCPHCQHRHALYPDSLELEPDQKRASAPHLAILEGLDRLAELPFSAALAASSESGLCLWHGQREKDDSASLLKETWLAIASKVLDKCDAYKTRADKQGR